MDSQIINVFLKGLGFTPIDKKSAISFIKKLSCKYLTQCSSTASCFLSTKKGYLPCCKQCVENDDKAVTHVLITHKYGEVNICNKYLKYINSLNCFEMDHMSLIDTCPLETYFIERHENPESEHYYMDFKNYYIPPKIDPDWNEGLEEYVPTNWSDELAPLEYDFY